MVGPPRAASSPAASASKARSCFRPKLPAYKAYDRLLKRSGSRRPRAEARRTQLGAIRAEPAALPVYRRRRAAIDSLNAETDWKLRYVQRASCLTTFNPMREPRWPDSIAT